jgi:hypothetical protein
MPRRGDYQTEHRYVRQIKRDHCDDGHRHWQEFVPVAGLRYWMRYGVFCIVLKCGADSAPECTYGTRSSFPRYPCIEDVRRCVTVEVIGVPTPRAKTWSPSRQGSLRKCTPWRTAQARPCSGSCGFERENAAGAGISAKTFYRLVPTKGDLFDAVVC